MLPFTKVVSNSVLAAAAILLSTGCNRRVEVHNNNSTYNYQSASASGRIIKATFDAPGNFRPDPPYSATISFDGHELKVERERFLLDGQERSKLSDTAKQVQITIMQRQLDVSADAVSVFSQKL